MVEVKKSILLLIIASFLGGSGVAQEIGIKLGPGEIALNQAYTITVSIQNGRIKSYDNFPEIKGLVKRGTSSSSSTNIVNGQISSTQSVSMRYIAGKVGSYIINPFTMTVNGQKVSSDGGKVKVASAQQRQNARDPFSHDPFDDLFGKRRQSTEFVDVQEDAFLALSSDKSEVYIGEGFTATLSFYVSENNRAPLQFYDLGRQLGDILKKLKPSNCWEENFNIENINGEPVNINGKDYTQYKIYQAAFYPLNLEPIEFPSVGLEMIKYMVAKNPSFFGQNRKEDYKTFYSRAKTIGVVDLPPHPLKAEVAVGHFRLNEQMSKDQVETGQSFEYQFNLYGEGNISSIAPPKIPTDDNFDFYPPNIEQNINRESNHVTGSKSFKYFGIPNEPGQYNLADYFQWIFFNTKTDEYDTLTSDRGLVVTGESKKNEAILANDLGSFYDLIELEDNTLVSRTRWATLRTFGNIFILLMLGVGSFIIFKK